MIRFALAAALLVAPTLSQTATDVGLMMDGGVLTVIYGQDCGPFTCQPFQAGPTGAGQTYNVYVFGAPQRPFVLAAELPSGAPCISFPGLANALVLTHQPVTLTMGLTGQPSPTSTCFRGQALFQLQFPNGTPPGVDFVLQGIAISFAQQLPAFTVAIRSTTA